MVCRACGKESADEFSFCPHCGKRKITEIVCPSCAKESAVEFSFCPHCGEAFAPAPQLIESPNLPPEVVPAKEKLADQPSATKVGVTGRANDIGTYVFGAFSVIALLVSIIKGIVPIYLLESAIWAGAAWYWHRIKTHSELAKAIVIVLAALIAIGEVIQIASQFGSEPKQTRVSRPNPIDNAFTSQDSSTYQSSVPASAGVVSVPDAAEIEQQAVAFYKQKHYSDARPLFEQACNGGEMRACNDLGYLYARGLGGPQDAKKARDAYQRACDQGILSSCASLGSLYQDAGDGDNARKYFQKACNGGVAEGCDLLRGAR
jgi:ribosomal protein L32